MSEFVTVARPYAKAAFDFAVEHNSVERWQDMLAFAAEVTKNDQMAELLSGALAPETLSEAFIAICGEQLDENGQNLEASTLVLQAFDGVYKTVYPFDVASTDYVYPVPGWSER